MSRIELKKFVELSPGFNTAVDVVTDLDNDKKVGAYIPTEVSSEILFDMGENLHVSASRRARLITGTYGTGKSHLALILGRLYRDGIEVECLSPVLQKFKATWPGQFEKLQHERVQLSGKFLLVILNGDRWGSFDDSLLHALDVALREEGLKDLLPETAFHAAGRRIAELRKDYKKDYERLEEVCKEFGFANIKALEGRLDDMQRSAYDKFCEIHRIVCAGAQFFHHHLMSPAEVYAAVAKRLVEEEGYAGIAVIWDEFGRYMERVVKDPRGIEGQSIQDFAQSGCNNSHRNQIHLYLVCHRSLQDYVRINAILRASGMSKTEQEEWNKISGRFRQFNMRTTDHEVFQLIDQVVIQREGDPAWQDFLSVSRDYLDEWSDEAVRLRLFPEFKRSDLHRIVTLGSYPLHPMAAFCLPKISEKVAQNERTMFRFLSDSGADTLGPFLREAYEADSGGRPPFFSADKLWDFFDEDVSEHPIHRRSLSRFSQADIQIDPEDDLAKGIIKTLALLQVISSDRAPCTEELIAYTLGIPASERTTLREKLKSLCTQQENRSRVLVQTIKDGAYRFTGAASDDFHDKIEKTVEDRIRMVSPAGHLREISGELSLDTLIVATAYSDDYMLERALELEIVDVGELKTPERWLDNLGSGKFHDGYALVVLCGDGQQIEEAREIAEGTLKHPQIVIAVPREPIANAEQLLRKHEAIRHLENAQGNLYGVGAELREEWEHQDQDHLEAIGSIVRPMLDPDSRMLHWYANGEEIPNVVSRSRLQNAASGIMETVFPLTPKIAHERLTTETGRDTFVGARRTIIDTVLKRNGAELLAKENNAQFKTVIDFVYRRNGILLPKETGFILAEPDPNTFPAMNAVWKEIEKAIDRAKEAPFPVVELTDALRRPPFGLRTRSISLVVAAVLRKYIQRGNLSFDYLKSSSSTVRITRIDGKTLDESILSADRYKFVFVDIGQKHEAILYGIASAFTLDFDPDGDKGSLIEQIQQEITKWWRGLPLFAQQTEALEKITLSVRNKVLRPLAQDEADAQHILLNTVADMIVPADQKEIIAQEAVAELFSQVKKEIEEVVQTALLPNVDIVVKEVFGTEEVEVASGVEALSEWYTHLSQERQNIRVAGDASLLIRFAREIVQDEDSAMDKVVRLAHEITGMPLEDWGDDMLGRFRGRLESAKKTVEQADVIAIPPGPDGGGIVIPPPSRGQTSIVISDEEGTLQRTFVPVEEISSGGANLKQIIQGAVEAIERTLPSGECETILVGIIKDTLK